MSDPLTFSVDQVAPDAKAVYGLQGFPVGSLVSDRVAALFVDASERFRLFCDAKGVVEAISQEKFERVYMGEGNNEVDTPVAEVFPQADHLALFALTLGPRVVAEIAELFCANDFALASMLDSVASAAADGCAEVVQREYETKLRQRDGVVEGSLGVLRYSPGYCGWHVSGQVRLFDYLRPKRIGLVLGNSFLMDPLKSVSGVLIAGPRRIHEFSDSYEFCSQCETRGCRERIRALLADSSCTGK